MLNAKKTVYLLAGLALSALLFTGCSGDQNKTEEKKTVTPQEQLGKDAAEAVQKPMEEARQAAAQVEEKTEQVVQEAADKTKEVIDETKQTVQDVVDATKEKVDEAKKDAEEAGLIPSDKKKGADRKKLEGC
ncbi:hypothetical protein [Desulfobulbus oligotrophicus]|jgi:PBP1b-binding outer membrane lipoprotein LpoB|uniref:Uncharacterized protein n=1 Tax=Desulfobulbus oligotrophicus TaxID=1909699 RepID=A0A7T6ARU0_9BACT|nr:hypothetical protein [Desulfobulbus oligotrophicus]MDY0391431.1 hypothetical protein [Desulfobulbus oligotrophicus]QQG66875.1 hypothetical protein HP555_13880 [Desulfobulbus oligotrophicus]